MPAARPSLLVLCLLLWPLLLCAQGPAEPNPAPRTEYAPVVLADAPSAARTTAEELLPALPRISLPVAPAITQPFIAPAPAPQRKVLDKKFFLWTGFALLATVADVELTQRCLHHHTCRELNPTLPHGHAAMYLANIPATGALFYWSYRRKAQGKKLWWLPTLIDAAPHAGGAIDNMRFK